MNKPHNHELSYVKGLDGIRGIAVLLVIMIHSHLCSFGWVGVQMFFVLSGFLITRILVSETGQNLKSYLLRFYWRRGLRIWPVYFGFLALCAIAYAFIRVPETMPKAWALLTTFTYNFARFQPSFQDSNYFGHFWSLCIEEQFYLVWPFVVFFASRAWLRRITVILIVGAPIIRLFTAKLLGQHYDDYFVAKGIYSLPTSHMDAFAFGALLTVLPETVREWMSSRSIKIFLTILAVTVLAGVTHSYICHITGRPSDWKALGYGGLTEFGQYAWAYTVLNATSAALILCALNQNWISNLLNIRWLSYIGKVSFGLYVFHLPLMYNSHAIWPAGYHSTQGLIRFSIYFIVTFGLAACSYEFFEKRFLALKDSGWGAPKRSV